MGDPEKPTAGGWTPLLGCSRLLARLALLPARGTPSAACLAHQLGPPRVPCRGGRRPGRDLLRQGRAHRAPRHRQRISVPGLGRRAMRDGGRCIVTAHRLQERRAGLGLQGIAPLPPAVLLLACCCRRCGLSIWLVVTFHRRGTLWWWTTEWLRVWRATCPVCKWTRPEAAGGDCGWALWLGFAAGLCGGAPPHAQVLCVAFRPQELRVLA